MLKVLNWLNGTRPKRMPTSSNARFGRNAAIAPLPQGNEQPTTYLAAKNLAHTRPLSEKILEEYRKGRDSVIGGFKNDK